MNKIICFQQQLRESRQAQQKALVVHNNKLAYMSRYGKVYRESAIGKIASSKRDAKRRAILKSIACTLTASDWQTLCTNYYNLCAYCKQPKPLTKDHVIPLSKGGQHTKENIVPACKQCNSKKGAKLAYKP